MKISSCQFCDSPDITRSRYFGVSFGVSAILTFGLALLFIPLMAVTVRCRYCDVEYIAG